MSAPATRRSACRAAANRGRLLAERLRAVPHTRGRAAEGLVDTAPPPAHMAELAVAATEVWPLRGATPVGVLEAGTQRPTATRDRAMQAPPVAEQAMNAVLRVELELVPAGQGSRATRERRERRNRGANLQGAERRRQCGQALPTTVAAAASTAAARMLCEGRDGNGRVAPWKRPQEGHPKARGQRRRVAVATPTGPPPRAPASTQSSARTAPTSCTVWAVGGGGGGGAMQPTVRHSMTTGRGCLAQAAIKLIYVFFLPAGFLGRGWVRGPLCCILPLHARARDGCAPLWRCGLLFGV